MFTHEIISYHKNLPMKLYFQRIGNVAKHWHQSMELLLVLNGEASVRVEAENYLLQEGDIIVINPQQIHETHGKDCIIAMLQIRLSMFAGSDVHENAQFSCNSSLYQNKERFRPLLRIFAQLIQLNSTSLPMNRTSLLNISYAYAMMHELMLNFYLPEGKASSHNTEALERLKNITSYLEEHYMENITLKSMAEQQYLSSSYLSHFFEKNMNMTFSAYLANIRLSHATQELLCTDHYIEDIALNNGFPNSRAFVTAFRKQYHMLPSQYRVDSAAKQQSILEESRGSNYLELEKHDFLAVLNQYLDRTNTIPSQAAPVLTQNYGQQSIDVSQAGTPLRHTFKVFTSVGRASDLLRAEVQEMLTVMQREIGFSYIKFHGILDDNLHLYREDQAGNPVLSFSYMDKVTDFLLSVGLRPLIQFSFMPKALAADPSQQLFADPVIISPPKDEEKWCYLIEKLVSHYISRYGYPEVSQWFFSFWNETFSHTPFSLGSLDLVCRLYELTWRSVKRCGSALRMGNPSLIASFFPDGTFERFLAYCQEHACLPDFHVLHFYPIEQGGIERFQQVTREEYAYFQPTDITLSTDPDLLHKFIDSYHVFAEKYPGTPAYLTEWSSTSSHRDWLNDTCFRSAYICKNILENYDQLESFGNWTLTDYIDELELDDHLFHGGMGSFTRNGIKKPAYYAFLFLSRLKDWLVKRGNGYFVTADGQGNYTLLLYNYSHYTSLYAQGILFDGSPESRYDAFGEMASMDIELTFEHIASGSYRLREQFVNRSYGSCYDEWVRMGAEPFASPEEEALLRSRSVPMLSKSTLEARDGRLSYYAHLEPLEIRLAELIYVPKNP